MEARLRPWHRWETLICLVLAFGALSHRYYLRLQDSDAERFHRVHEPRKHCFVLIDTGNGPPGTRAIGTPSGRPRGLDHLDIPSPDIVDLQAQVEVLVDQPIQ